MQYEILVKVDEELVKREQERNIAQERDKEEQAVAKESKKTMAVIEEIALMSARELVVSKVGEFTRNSLLQRQIDVGASVITTIGAFAIHPLLGAISVATSTASQVISYNINSTKEQTRLEVMSGRAGYMNRSR